MDENISLNIVAERFHLSEAYLSRIFKEQTGENFTACLERIRLNHAQRLLTQTRIPIHEIVHRVGYVYDDTFRKAFKRFHGISPGEYRLLADTQPEKTG
jgi:YesN/AraC family two-component response regulator